MTVKQLRNMGYKVRVLHYREYIETQSFGGIREYLSPKGGSTQVIIDSPNGEHFIGEAICSKKENYNKKLGVRIALGRSGVFDYLKASNAY